jgi:hypothetical protein
MKKSYFKITAMVVFAAVVAMGCGSSKQVTQQQGNSTQNVDDIDQQIVLKKKQMELDAIEADSKRRTLLNKQQYDDLIADIEQKKQKTRKMVSGENPIIIFCKDDAFDKPGEYMGGLGVVEDRPDRTRAIVDANRAAIADIASRYIGMIKNAIDDYSKDVNVPSGKKMYESLLEGGAAVIGSKVINKYANVACREVSQSSTGSWVGYVAVRVLLQEANKGLADELEALKVDYDKQKFFEKMDAELEKEAIKRKTELDAME